MPRRRPANLAAAAIGQLLSGEITSLLTGTLYLDLNQPLETFLRPLRRCSCSALDVEAPRGDDAQAQLLAFTAALQLAPNVKLIKLRRLGAQVELIQPLCSYLNRSSCTLVALNLSGCGLRFDSTQALAGALVNNRSLTACDMTQNEIDVDGGGALMQMMRQNSRLTALALEGNPVSWRSSKKNTARQIIDRINAECRWNFISPLARQYNNACRHWVLVVLQKHGIHERAVSSNVLSQLPLVADMKHDFQLRRHFVQRYDDLKAPDEAARLGQLKDCVPFSFSSTAANTTRQVAEVSKLDSFLGAVFLPASGLGLNGRNINHL